MNEEKKEDKKMSEEDNDESYGLTCLYCFGIILLITGIPLQPPKTSLELAFLMFFVLAGASMMIIASYLRILAKRK